MSENAGRLQRALAEALAAAAAPRRAGPRKTEFLWMAIAAALAITRAKGWL